MVGARALGAVVEGRRPVHDPLGLRAGRVAVGRRLHEGVDGAVASALHNLERLGRPDHVHALLGALGADAREGGELGRGEGALVDEEVLLRLDEIGRVVAVRAAPRVRRVGHAVEGQHDGRVEAGALVELVGVHRVAPEDPLLLRRDVVGGRRHDASRRRDVLLAVGRHRREAAEAVLAAGDEANLRDAALIASEDGRVVLEPEGLRRARSVLGVLVLHSELLLGREEGRDIGGELALVGEALVGLGLEVVRRVLILRHDAGRLEAARALGLLLRVVAQRGVLAANVLHEALGRVLGRALRLDRIIHAVALNLVLVELLDVLLREVRRNLTKLALVLALLETAAGRLGRLPRGGGDLARKRAAGADDLRAASDLDVDGNVAVELHAHEVARAVARAVVDRRRGATEAPEVGGGVNVHHIREEGRDGARVLEAEVRALVLEEDVRARVRVGDLDERAAGEAVDDRGPLLLDDRDVRAEPRVGRRERARHHHLEHLCVRTVRVRGDVSGCLAWLCYAALACCLPASGQTSSTPTRGRARRRRGRRRWCRPPRPCRPQPSCKGRRPRGPPR